jgi:hypothetical protein
MMAGALIEIADLAAYPPFRRRVRAAMTVAAVSVAAEQPDSGQPERSNLRRSLATNILARLDDHEERFAHAVAANPVITSGSSDNDVQFTVNSVFDAVAGAPPVPA